MEKICDRLASKQLFYFSSMNEELSYHSNKDEHRIEASRTGESISFYHRETKRRGEVVVVYIMSERWATQAWIYNAAGERVMIESTPMYKEDEDQQFAAPLIERMIQYLDSPTGIYSMVREYDSQ